MRPTGTATARSTRTSSTGLCVRVYASARHGPLTSNPFSSALTGRICYLCSNWAHPIYLFRRIMKKTSLF